MRSCREFHRSQSVLEPLRRSWKWIFTGPLEFQQRVASADTFYRAGDALSFVDPFTGSGLLCAIATGALAGEAAGSSISYAEYRMRCSRCYAGRFVFLRCSGKLLGPELLQRFCDSLPLICCSTNTSR
jgi:flavin-dependent dehydrogenase